VTHFHAAIGQDVLEAPAAKLHAVEVGGAEACTAQLTLGDGDGAVVERDATTVGEGDPEDRGGEVWERCGPSWIGLAVDVPRKSPGLWVDVLPQSGLAHVFFEESAGDGGEGFDGDKAVGSGGALGGAVLGEAAARDDGVDVGVVLELPAPGVQDAGAPREVGPDAALVGGEPLEGRCRGLKHGRYARRWCERKKGLSVSGTVKVRRKCGPGRRVSRWCWSHWWVVGC
jgi:hypothetical protein